MTVKAQTYDPRAAILDAQRRSIEPRELGALCAALLLIDDARLCGLVDGAPEVERERCEDVLSELARDGVTIDVDEASGKMLELLAEIGVAR